MIPPEIQSRRDARGWFLEPPENVDLSMEGWQWYEDCADRMDEESVKSCGRTVMKEREHRAFNLLAFGTTHPEFNPQANHLQKVEEAIASLYEKGGTFGFTKE